MDSISPSKKAIKEVARESLIAISSTLSEESLDLNCISEGKKADGNLMSYADGDDKFRSELISISYVESPDIKFL